MVPHTPVLTLREARERREPVREERREWGASPGELRLLVHLSP